MSPELPVNEWATPEHALEYLARADHVPHRTEGEAALLEFLPESPRRVLDLGTGDGRLLALVLLARPEIEGVAVDFSPTMLHAARARFAEEERVTLVDHDLDEPLPAGVLGTFDAVVSSFAVHHCADARKRALYGEVLDLLEPGGAFLNLEHVASPTPALHRAFRAVVGGREDPSNRLAAAETQLAWLRDLGFQDVDCHWKWRELALLGGVKPARPLRSRP